MKPTKNSAVSVEKPSWFKTPKIAERERFLHPFARQLLDEMRTWCLQHHIPFLVTETVTTAEEDNALDRVSASHRECRAFDLSVRGWSALAVESFRTHFTAKYGSLGAIGKESGEPRLLVYHNTGRGLHFHVQLNRSYALHFEE